MQIANYPDEYFVFLLQIVNKYNKVWACDDGNIYQDEESARLRKITTKKLHTSVLRYAEITIENFPSTNEDLEKLWVESHIKQEAVNPEISIKPETQITFEEAQESLKKLRDKKKPDKKGITDNKEGGK